MRFAAPAIALSLAFTTVSSVGYGKRVADDQIDPQSMALTKLGMEDAAAGQLEAVSYKHLTLPTNREVENTCGVRTVNKKVAVVGGGQMVNYMRRITE